MRPSEPPTPSPDAAAGLRRRGILAALAALAASALAKLTTRGAQAADSANLVVGAQSYTSLRRRLLRAAPRFLVDSVTAELRGH